MYACVVFQHRQWLLGPHLQLFKISFLLNYILLYSFIVPFNRLITLRLCQGLEFFFVPFTVSPPSFSFVPSLALSFSFFPFVCCPFSWFPFLVLFHRCQIFFSADYKSNPLSGLFITHHLSPSFRCGLLCCTMSNPLVVVVQLDGFQHGPDELTPKCLAVACDALQLASQWFFQTGFFGLSTQGIPVHLLSSIDICPWPTANGPH